MKIMSFNIRCANVGKESWIQRIGIVCKTILNSNADSVGVQEAHTRWMSVLHWKLRKKYAHIGIGREDGKHRGEHSAIFYLKDKYNLIDQGNFWLSETPDIASKGWDADCKRICTWGIFENKTTKERYMHINTHFDHIGVVARRKSVEMIIEKAKSFPKMPVVFTADMNVFEGDENYLQFVNSNYFRDTKYLAPDTMSHCTFHGAEPENHKDEIIDFVMVNDCWNVEKYRVMTEGVDGRFVSDHFPVYAIVEMVK